MSQRQRLVRLGLLVDVNEPFALTEAGRITLRDEGTSGADDANATVSHGDWKARVAFETLWKKPK